MANLTVRYELGSVVRDRITGFKGVVTGITAWLNGCVRYCVQPQELKDGKPIEPEWVDEQQAIQESPPEDREVEKRGGPMPDPKF